MKISRLGQSIARHCDVSHMRVTREMLQPVCLSVKRQASAIRRERGRCSSNEGNEETSMLAVAPHVTHKRTEEGMAWMLDPREAHAPVHHACKSE